MKITPTNVLSSFPGSRHPHVGLFTLMLSLFTLAPAEQIFLDSLSGSSQVRLNTTAPRIRPGQETWNASNSWKADGTYTLEENDIRRHRGAFLPFSGFSSPGVYTLSATISSVEGVTASMGLTKGGTQHTGHATSAVFALFMSLDGSGGFAGEVRARGDGISATRVAGAFNYGEPVTLHLALDTRGETWTASFWVGEGERTTLKLDDDFKTAFTGIGFHVDKSATRFPANTQVVVDNFSLISEFGTVTEDQ